MRNWYSKLVMTGMCLSGMLICAPVLIEAWQHPTPPQPTPKPSPNAPISQNVPQGLEGVPTSVETSKQTLNQQNEQEIRLQVQRLYAMATELKDELDRTNTSVFLNITVMKRAQDIEKLAKQIRDRAKR
jgi:hypothetical protein